MKYATKEIADAVVTLLQGSHSWGEKWQRNGALNPPAFPYGTLSAYFPRNESAQGQNGADTLVRLDLFARTDDELHQAMSESNDLLDHATLTLANSHANWCTTHDGSAPVRVERRSGDQWWRGTQDFRVRTVHSP